MNAETRLSFHQLLIKHAEVFARNDSDLGRTDVVCHDIDTGETRPICPRRIPKALQSEFEQEMQNIVDKGVIERGQSKWAFLVVLVRKKDDSLRFCVDNHHLNDITKFDTYSLPRIDKTLEALSGAKLFCTLDLLSGY